MEERRLLAKFEWLQNFGQLIGLVFVIGAVLVPTLIMICKLAAILPS